MTTKSTHVACSCTFVREEGAAPESGIAVATSFGVSDVIIIVPEDATTIADCPVDVYDYKLDWSRVVFAEDRPYSRSTKVESGHSPRPFEVVDGNEHHGPYIVDAAGCTVADLYAMSDPSSLSVRNGGTSKPIPFSCAQENAKMLVRAINYHQELITALGTLYDIVSGLIHGREELVPEVVSEMRQAHELLEQLESLEG